jgi:hypothetical protein
MERFTDLKLLEDRLKANFCLPDIGKIAVEFDLEEEDSKLEDFNALISIAQIWIKGLTKEILDGLMIAIANELTDAAYTGSDYKPSSSDYINLQRDLNITMVRFYPDSVFSLIFEAEKEYPDMEIYCLLDESFSIEDLTVDRK